MKRILVENRNAIRYSIIDTANRDVKPRFWMMNQPVAGPTMLARAGITEEKRLIDRARCLARSI